LKTFKHKDQIWKCNQVSKRVLISVAMILSKKTTIFLTKFGFHFSFQL
jgi:hypothetical protein